MGWREILKDIRGKEEVAAVDLLQQISKRAEDLTPEEQARSFVSIRRIDGALRNRDSRIIFGRRGTGKTHILSYVASAAEKSGDIPIVIDLRTLGSNNSIYSDQSLEAHARATRLIRDLITGVHDGLVEKLTHPKSSLKAKGIDEALGALANSVKSVVVTSEQKDRRAGAAVSTQDVQASATGRLSVRSADVSFSAGARESREERGESETTIKGIPRLSVNMGDAFRAFENVARQSRSRIWLLLDEWSSLPVELQPYLADFLRRAVLPVQNLTVQIAAIEFRTQFRLDFERDRVGLELGSDITADINLDDYFVYDVSADASLEFFRSLLFKHLEAFSGARQLKERNENAVINSVFSQDRVFAELVRASEGVPRDFINILQLAAMRSDQSKISMNEVRVAAKDWYERDKQRNLDTNERADRLLQWIRDKVIEGKRARAFLLRLSRSDSSIEFLFDERLLHIAKRSYSAKDEPGVRYRVWKVDYGCYVDLMNTAKTPTGFLFADSELSDAGEIIVPEDDYRAVRRAILDLSEFDG